MASPCVAQLGATLCGQSTRSKASRRRDRCRRIAVRYDRKWCTSETVGVHIQNHKLPCAGDYSCARTHLADTESLTDVLPLVPPTASLAHVEIVQCKEECSHKDVDVSDSALYCDDNYTHEHVCELLQTTAVQAAENTGRLVSELLQKTAVQAAENTMRLMNVQFEARLNTTLERVSKEYMAVIDALRAKADLLSKEYMAVVDALRAKVDLLTATGSTQCGLEVITETEEGDTIARLIEDAWQYEEHAKSSDEEIKRDMCPISQRHRQEYRRTCESTSPPNEMRSRKSVNPSDDGEPKAERRRRNCKKK